MSSQYSEGGGSSNANSYASLPDYYSSVPLVGTGVSVIQLDPFSRPYLDLSRTSNLKSGDPVYRSGYATLAGTAPNPRTMRFTGENLTNANSDYFTLESAYKLR